MGRPLPLHVVLCQLAHEARETMAAQLLTMTAVRDVCSKAAREGLNCATIPLGPVNLEYTAAGQALIKELRGFQLEWRSGGLPGKETWELWLGWNPKIG